MQSGNARSLLIRRLTTWLTAVVGVLAIVLAVALGVFRLLIGQIPEYQAELKTWVADELGLVVDFASLDARLGLTGPELSLRDASIGEGAGGGFLQADTAALTLDPFALLLGRRVEISRLTLGGVHLTVERDADGVFNLGEHPLVPSWGPLSVSVPESVRIVIRDSALRYVDEPAERTWDFADLELVVEAGDGRITARAGLRPDAGLANRIELSASADIPDPEVADVSWAIEATAVGLDLETLSDLVPTDFELPLAGRGDATVGASWLAGQLFAAHFDVDFEAAQIGTADPANPPYDRLAVSGEWRRDETADWRLDLDAIDVARGGRAWDRAASGSLVLDRDENGIRAVSISGEFLRIDDLEPIVRAFPETGLARQWLRYEPAGDLSDLSFVLERRGDTLEYELDTEFSGLAVSRAGTMPGFTGLAGTIRATEGSGTLELASREFSLDWPLLFDRSVTAESITGAVGWRQPRDLIQIFSSNLAVGLLGETALASFELRFPRDGSSPMLDLEAKLAAVDVVPAKAYLPAPILPESVFAWLEQAVAGGRARDIELSFYGPVRAFPFDDGSGQFRVTAAIEDATLNYMPEWPAGEGLDGSIEFLNAGFTASGEGRTLSNRADQVTIGIPDMRDGILNLTAKTEGPLSGVIEYLRTAPLIAAHLGPDFSRLDAQGGTGSITASVSLPLRDPAAYTLDASLEIADGTLAIAGLKPEISEINGEIRAREDAVEATELEAVFLGGAVKGSVARSERAGYRAELAVEGETTIEAVAESFALPHEDIVAGQTLWRGRLLLPALDPLATTPTRIVIESNLTGVALRLPEPMAKAPSEPSNLRLDLEFAAGNRLEVTGNLGATRRFALSFESGATGLEFARGAIRFGGEEPMLPIQPGILVSGRIERLALDPWLDLAGTTGTGAGAMNFLGADIEVAEFQAFGQQLGDTSLMARKGVTAWDIDVESEAIAGEIVVPRGIASREPIVASMQRVYLASAEGSAIEGVDPRSLPGLRLEADAFGIGSRQLGRVSATVEPDRRGLVLAGFSSESENLRIDITGNWFQGPLRMRTTIDATVTSTDVEAALAELGLDPVVGGEAAELSAHLYWDAAPGADWLDHINGEVNIFVDTGTLREIDPGAGRMLGLMSIAALPRRLALDFRDVFEDGFAFDEIGGHFTLIDGNAYTNDLKFTGPAAEIGVVGRTGLRDRDYTQQVVVSPEPGNMLPTVAGLLAGPGAGAALFVFTRLFKQPLKGIGQASYCLEGSWEEPRVEPIENDEQERARQCADIPEAMREAIVDD